MLEERASGPCFAVCKECLVPRKRDITYQTKKGLHAREGKKKKGLSSPAMRGPLPSITNYLKKIIITQAALVDRDVDRQVVSCSHDPFTLLLLPPPCHARHPATNVF